MARSNCSLAFQANVKRLRVTGLYSPPATTEEVWESSLITLNDFLFLSNTSQKEIPAKPRPTIR